MNKTINITKAKEYWRELDRAFRARARIVVKGTTDGTITYCPVSCKWSRTKYYRRSDSRQIITVSKAREELLHRIEDRKDEVVIVTS